MYSYSIPYLLIFFSFLFISFPVININEESNGSISLIGKYHILLQYYFVALLFLLFFGFRGFVYTDWINYYAFYNEEPTLYDGVEAIKNFFTNSMYSKVGWEKGFLLFSIFIKSISINYFWWQFFFVLFDYIILYNFFVEYLGKYWVLGFAFFMIYSGVGLEFNLFRNSKAIYIFLLGYKYLCQRKLVKYLIVVFIACLFHTSSIIYIPAYFLLNHRFSRKTIFVFFVLGNFIFIFKIHYLLAFIENILNIFHLQRISYLLRVYTNTATSYNISLMYLVRLFDFLIIYFVANKYIPYKEKYQLYNCFFLYHFIYLYFTDILVFVERFPTLFVFSCWILYPLLYSKINKKNKIVFIFILILCGSIILVKSNSRIICKYDNYIFGNESYEYRAKILNKFESK